MREEDLKSIIDVNLWVELLAEMRPYLNPDELAMFHNARDIIRDFVLWQHTEKRDAVAGLLHSFIRMKRAAMTQKEGGG